MARDSTGFCGPDGDDMELQLSSDEGDEAITMAKYCHENQWISNPNGFIDFKEEQIFGNAKLVRKAIKNDINRYTVKCKNETCDWRFHASYLLNGLTFMIMSVRGGHSLCLRTTSNMEANFKWVSEVVRTTIMTDPTILPKVLKNELQEKYAIKCDSQIIYKAKKRVLKNLKADHMNSYAKIKQYANTWPRAGSRYYFRHIIANFRATFENLNMTEKLWAASRVGDAAGFKEVMESINNDLVKARHTFDPRIKSDHNTNNMSECFNSWIKDDRDKPILTLMESLRRKVMKFEYGISLYARGRINDNDKEGKKLRVIYGRGNITRRSIYSTKKMLFNLKEKTCNCGLWEFSGILCKHALVAFSLNNQFFLESVHWYYSKEAMKLTYNGNINLLVQVKGNQLKLQSNSDCFFNTVFEFCMKVCLFNIFNGKLEKIIHF
ncbi:hypothetical protein ACOSQ2_019312 [Xanthoceras sorbifolium]